MEFKLPKTGEKIYLEPIVDLYEREILTYEVTAKGSNLSFTLSPLEKLLNKRPSLSYQMTIHTDQGWQYRHKLWRQFLKKNKLIPSMSHKARCLDNVCIEGFFNKLKVELRDLKEYQNLFTFKFCSLYSLIVIPVQFLKALENELKSE